MPIVWCASDFRLVFRHGIDHIRSAMRCPYCHNPLIINSSECPSCRLSYPRTVALLGAAPRLGETLSDGANLIPASDRGRLRKRIADIQERFPQLVLEVVTYRFPLEHPFSTHVFWLFNAAGFAGSMRRGKDNHAIMLVIDPGRLEAAVIPGYGLEPFLSGEALGHLLDLATPAWEEGRWVDGILRVINGLDTWLETIAIPDLPVAKSAGDF